MYLVCGVNFLFLFNFPPKSKRRQNEFFPSFTFHFGSRFSLSTQLELNLVDFNHPEAIRDIYKADIPIFYSKCLQLVQDSRLELQFLVEKDMWLSSPSFQNSLSQGSRGMERGLGQQLMPILESVLSVGLVDAWMHVVYGAC
ncbi:uncharacterized protein LOC132059628 [Lycium ferocissimum]|uniref:uncharacterized protein LOC132059628 n=1 Tax=Lycium ferocissimum TaxID=112874 RepID=UPI0028151932|nr:uncharacterized protein LOC132059628 [Lycium ferocissimum]XP_059308288.1 uncharacterized protein LOC132059628 [Lycium ferocissimum]